MRCVIVCALLFSSSATPGQNTVSPEYRNKATFLVTFLDFVEWPPTAFSSPHAPFVICVRGNFLFGTSLADVARAASPQGKRVEVRWIHEDEKLRACHIAFVGRSEGKRYAKILRALDGADVLTIGETPDFLGAGGAMSFSFQPDVPGSAPLQFEVSLPAVRDAHLTVSSKLLAVARRVTTLPEDGKRWKKGKDGSA